MKNIICKKRNCGKILPPRRKVFCSDKCANVVAVTRRRRKLKEMGVAYKGGKCTNCGYNKSVWALDFHHIGNKEKGFAISHNGHTKSWDEIKRELDKCILLCANCHREEHAKDKFDY